MHLHELSFLSRVNIEDANEQSRNSILQGTLNNSSNGPYSENEVTFVPEESKDSDFNKSGSDNDKLFMKNMKKQSLK